MNAEEKKMAHRKAALKWYYANRDKVNKYRKEYERTHQRNRNEYMRQWRLRKKEEGNA